MPPLDGDADGWVICDYPVSPARPACDCQPNEPTIYPGAPCNTGLLGVCSTGSYDCSSGPGSCSQTTFPTSEVCNDGLDNDCDGSVDCGDADCFADPSCVGGVEDCGNGIDDDGDGFIDCADPDCNLDPACISGSENCSDGVDNDGDGLIDCADPDCQAVSCGTGCICLGYVKQETDCTNGIDDDGDGLTDCADPMCAEKPICGGGNEVCNNGVDDDGDGYADCYDGACETDPRCLSWLVLGTGNPGALCNTGAASPCASGRESQVSFTCKPMTFSCY